MGLLDDAIREHLELKRRRGADPAEVARAQREALDPVPDREARSEPGDAAQGEPLGEEGPPAAGETLASVGAGETGNMEETAELDMDAMLQHEPPPESASFAEEESPEGGVPEQIGSQSGAEPRAVADPAEERAGSHGYDEERDAVDEIPEQERLHFEQGAREHADTE